MADTVPPGRHVLYVDSIDATLLQSARTVVLWVLHADEPQPWVDEALAGFEQAEVGEISITNAIRSLHHAVEARSRGGSEGNPFSDAELAEIQRALADSELKAADHWPFRRPRRLKLYLQVR